jgi:hypothetical protein
MIAGMHTDLRYGAYGSSLFTHNSRNFQEEDSSRGAIETKRDEHGIEIDPFYQPHIVEYHCVDTTKLNRKGRNKGAARSPSPGGGKDWNADE